MTTSTDRNETAERRRAFGEALGEAMQMRSMTQLELGQTLGITQSAVSAWKAGQAAPEPDVVFAVEQSLTMPAGWLSRHLGFVPADFRKQPPVSVPDAALVDPLLDEPGKRAVIAVYRELTSRGGVKRGRPKASSTPKRPRR